MDGDTENRDITATSLKVQYVGQGKNRPNWQNRQNRSNVDPKTNKKHRRKRYQ